MFIISPLKGQRSGSECLRLIVVLLTSNAVAVGRWYCQTRLVEPQLVDWSIDWLVGRSIDRLIDTLILIDRSIDWSIDRLIDRLIDWLIDWLVDGRMDGWIDRFWLIDWLILTDCILTDCIRSSLITIELTYKYNLEPPQHVYCFARERSEVRVRVFTVDCGVVDL